MKRLFFKKIAYTLAEILFIIAIIGIITTITIHNTKMSQNQYKKLYAVAFDTLVQTVGNAHLAWKPANGQCTSINDKTTSIYWSRDCWEQYTMKRYEEIAVGGISGFPRQYPGFLYGNGYAGEYSKGTFDGSGTDVSFCNALTSQINTVDEDNQCKSFISGVKPDVDMKVGNNFLKSFCALIEDVDETTGKVKTDKSGARIGKCAGTGSLIPSFVASNGQKYYISTVMYANPPYIDNEINSGIDADSYKERMPFRFIAVDLNGDNGPNTQLRIGNKMPDIVLFAVTAEGKVIPLGWPEFDELYLSAAVYYPKYLLEREALDKSRYKKNTLVHSDLMTFFNAKMHAWAGTAAGGCVGCYYGQPLVLSEPYSFSNLFYYWGVNCVKDGCAGKSGVQDGYYYADKIMADLIWQFSYYTGYNDDGKHVPNSFIPTVVESGNIDTEYGCSAGVSRCWIDFSDK